MPKIKNIIIFVVIGTILVLIYIFFIKSSPEAALISATPVSTSSDLSSDSDSSVARDFLTLLLSVKNIKLDDAVFSDKAFINLHDSSITLMPDGTEGRPNPFAPLGVDNITPIPVTSTTLTIPLTFTPSAVTPPTTTTPSTTPAKSAPAVKGPVKP